MILALAQGFSVGCLVVGFLLFVVRRRLQIKFEVRLASQEESRNQLLQQLAEAQGQLKARSAEAAELKAVRAENSELQRKVFGFEEGEEQRKTRFSEDLHRLNLAFTQRESERARDIEKKNELEESRCLELKNTWRRHERVVEEKLQLICQRHLVEYVAKEKFPLKGKPDNAIKIGGEYIVFDSKSPEGDDLSHFPSYIRAQAEAAKKYVSAEGVKNDIFLVVPTEAIGGVTETYLAHGKYRVHVITPEALEPIVINLKKIEDYDFVDNLSPDEREKIVAIIGKMAHGMKRRIQIDYFFANEFISILSDAENLPVHILGDAQKVERSSKLNPPQERRAKVIDTKELGQEVQRLGGKAVAQQINIETGLSPLDLIPLHKS